MPTPQISAREQLMLELLNRARLDPSGEAKRFGVSLNDGLSAGTISSSPKAPLAFDSDLNKAAANHSSWMLVADTFSHTGSGGSSPTNRMKAAGYDFTGSWTTGENIASWGTTGTLKTTTAIYKHHQGLFLSAGHRENIFGDFREVGIAQEVGDLSGYTSSMLTQNFAKTSGKAFITGVAYTDRDGDRFYDVGEGKSGVAIDWLGNSGGVAKSAKAGGFAVKIPTGLDGMAAASVTVGDTVIRAKLDMTGTNVKLDVINGRILASSTDLTLGMNGKDARLLGVANTDLTGNGRYNALEGNSGSNELRGGGGKDLLKGGRGNDDLVGGSGKDTLKGGKGNDDLIGGTGRDILTGGSGADDFVFLSTRHSTPGSTTRDIITDFARGRDDIVVSRIDANTGRSGNQDFALDTNSSFSAGEIRQTVSNGNLTLAFNTDGDSAAEMVILLRGMTSKLSATDFDL